MRFSSIQILAGLSLIVGMAFIYFIINNLYGVFDQAYFWDELGVYSRSSMYLYEHGLSLLPSACPDELSRGHPLLCPLYFASAFKFFGCKPFVAHIAAASLNAIAFIFLWAILLHFTEPFIATVSTLAIFAQALFLSQSVLILPEMPLMVLTMAAVYFYTNEKIIMTAICLVLALQVKESALVLPFAFLLSESLKQKRLLHMNNLYLFVFPMLSFLIFILVQKVQRDYFFYPLHTSLASTDPYYIHERWDSFKLFLNSSQNYLFFVIAFAIVAVINLFVFLKKIPSLISNRYNILFFIIGGALFFMVLNYFLSRYTLYFMILSYLVFFIFVFNIVQKKPKIAYLPAVALLILGCSNWNKDRDYTDIDFSYSQHIKTVKMCTDDLNTPQFNGKTIGMDFPISAVYWNSNNGYQVSNNHHMCPLYDSSCKKDFILLSHPGNMSDSSKFSADYQLYKTYQYGYAYCKLYQHKDSIQ